MCIYALCEIIPSLKLSFSIVSYFDFSIIIFFLFILFTLGLFFLLDGFRQWGWLRAILVFLRVIHDYRWVHWEILLVVAELVSVTQINLLHLAVVEEAVAARPDE